MPPSTSRHDCGPDWWLPEGSPPHADLDLIEQCIQDLGAPLVLVDADGQLAAGQAGAIHLGASPGPAALPLLAYAPIQRPEQLGDPSFCSTHGVRYPYVAGAMANGISSVELVTAASRAGLLGFFGSAGLPSDRIAQALDALEQALGHLPYGCNLIHSPAEPQLEAATVELYLRRNVRLVSAAAYMDLTLPIVRYRTAGIYRDGSGAIVAPNRVIAKVSRIEVARRFLAPPPEALLGELVKRGDLTASQATLARTIPMAQDLTAEADSGGHTDNQPALALVPTLLALRDQMALEHGYAEPPRIGAAGGLGTPSAVAAAFAMGAAYVLTGSINQCTREAGTSEAVRQMLAAAQQADVTMAPAADMFEMGVQVQVLKRGTMFPMRARRLLDLYRKYDSLGEIPPPDRAAIEKDLLRATCDEAWAATRSYFASRDATQIARADEDPKHQMALVFRSYLGQSSEWANSGEASRRLDYQIWCGPAMGAFNEWVRGTFLEGPGDRDVVTIAMNLLVGAAILTRVNLLRQQLAGGPHSLPPAASGFRPLRLAAITQLLQAGVHA